jgi:recombination protein RecA
MSDINEILSRLSPEMRKKVKKASEIKEEKIELPSIGLTRALEGGLRFGTQAMFWGNRSSGKTALAMGVVGIAQKMGKSAALVDAEGSYGPEWFKTLGVNTDELAVVREKSMEGVANTTVELIKNKIDVVVIDSISTLLPASYFDDGELKTLEKTGQIGAFSKDIAKMLGMFNYVNDDHTLVIVLSQVRNQIGSYGASLGPMGGKSVEHLNTTSIKLWTNLSEKEALTGDVSDGDYVFNQITGRKVTWTLDKDRGPNMGMSGEYNLYTSGDHPGIDRLGEMVDYGVKYGKIHKGGAWYTAYGDKFQGKAALVKHFREHPELQEKLAGEILG